MQQACTALPRSRSTHGLSLVTFVPFVQIQAAAEAANAHEFIAQLPDGYQTVVGDRGALLSGTHEDPVAHTHTHTYTHTVCSPLCEYVGGTCSV